MHTQTIITVLLVNQSLQQLGFTPRITCEILDQNSTELFDKKIGCEFVLSTDLTSRMLAQVASHASMIDVFNELLAPEGNEIYLKSTLLPAQTRDYHNHNAPQAMQASNCPYS